MLSSTVVIVGGLIVVIGSVILILIFANHGDKDEDENDTRTDDYMILNGCPDYMITENYQELKDKTLSQNPKAKLCSFGQDPSFAGYCDATSIVSGSLFELGTGYGYVGSCENGIKKFVNDFLKKCNDLQNGTKYRKYCITITAAALHESGFAANARSWDSYVPGPHGAVGVLQYDIASGINPLPLTPDQQLNALFCNGDLYYECKHPSIFDFNSKWASCRTTIAAGGTGINKFEYDAAKAACEQGGAENEEFYTGGELPDSKDNPQPFDKDNWCQSIVTLLAN